MSKSRKHRHGGPPYDFLTEVQGRNMNPARIVTLPAKGLFLTHAKNHLEDLKTINNNGLIYYEKRDWDREERFAS